VRENVDGCHWRGESTWKLVCERRDRRARGRPGRFRVEERRCVVKKCGERARRKGSRVMVEWVPKDRKRSLDAERESGYTGGEAWEGETDLH